jgi:cyclophilin family peptidyl-prolyl cis-trans isomerase
MNLRLSQATSLRLLPTLLVVAVLLQSCAVFKKKPADDLVTITTEVGTIDLILSDKTPLHKANFLKLAKEHYYDSTTFHRIIKGFMIQGGDPNSKDKDPNNDGNGGPGYTVPAEFDASLTHVAGAVCAARMGDDINPQKASSGSQFYIVENKAGAHFLDNNYTVFGQVLKGQEVVERIAEQRKNPMDRPLKDIKMTMRVKHLRRADIEKTYGYTYPKVAK